MNKHSVKFIRGSKTIWDQLNTTPEKIDNNTLYFIYEDENYSVGKLYLGQRLITDDKIINIKDIGDIQIDDESLIDKQILIYNEENQEWKNSSLEEIIDLSNYYTKNEVDNNISTKMALTPFNPTAEEITAMSDGQLYGDTINHKGVIKGGQEFYDSTVAVRVFENNDGQSPPLQIYADKTRYNRGDIWINLSYENGERVCTALYICKSVWMSNNSTWQYRWLCLHGANSEYYTKEEINSMIDDIDSATDTLNSNIDTLNTNVSNKMDLAPLNPTAQEIEAMPDGQLYGDTVNHKGIIKGGQEFYDTKKIEALLVQKQSMIYRAQPYVVYEKYSHDSRFPEPPPIGSLFVYDTYIYILRGIVPQDQTYAGEARYDRVGYHVTARPFNPPASEQKVRTISLYDAGDIYIKVDLPLPSLYYPSYIKNGTVYRCESVKRETVSQGLYTYTYEWEKLDSLSDYGIADAYTKTEINSMIPTVPANISAFTNDSGYLTLETLPIYDGTVI